MTRTSSCFLSPAGWLQAVLLISLFLIRSTAGGQVQSITAAVDYTSALGKRLEVQSASGVGGTVELRMLLSGPISLGLSAGYISYAIEQPDEIDRWNWQFWTERYYPKIESDLRANPALSVTIGSVQRMWMIPVVLSVLYAAELGEHLRVLPRVGGGVGFYTRTLYADETWTKQFPQAAHTFTYNLRNFAPEKKGGVPLGVLGCDITYRLAADLDVAAGATYRTAFAGSAAFADFPFKDEIQFRLAVTFLY